jgi:hypothetical protein
VPTVEVASVSVGSGAASTSSRNADPGHALVHGVPRKQSSVLSTQFCT